MRAFRHTVVASAVFMILSGMADAATPRGACASTALNGAVASALDSDKASKLESFAQVQPTDNERGAADAFFEARFRRPGSAELIRYRVFMLCEGMVKPATLAIQRKYD